MSAPSFIIDNGMVRRRTKRDGWRAMLPPNPIHWALHGAASRREYWPCYDRSGRVRLALPTCSSGVKVFQRSEIFSHSSNFEEFPVAI